MDTIYRLIEVYAGKLSNWAWDKRWKERDKKEDWVKGYREWKKRKCPHNQTNNIKSIMNYVMHNFPYDIQMTAMFVFITLYLVMEIIF